MPIYEYRCEKGHQFEVMQRISDDPVERLRGLRGAGAQVFHPVAVHFKGSGFYNTDYGTRKRAREMSESKEGKSVRLLQGQVVRLPRARRTKSESKGLGTESKAAPPSPTARTTTKPERPTVPLERRLVRADSGSQPTGTEAVAPPLASRSSAC